jgi:beta-carotene ketolase (CrtW type)
MGISIAVFIIIVWAAHLGWAITAAPTTSLLTPLVVVVQAFLYTGLFITAHDAMHGTVSRHRRVNVIVGTLACLLFAGMSYRRLIKNHKAHHDFPADDHADPDFHPSSRYLPWFAAFMWRYTTIPQLLLQGALFNLAAHGAGLGQEGLILFWIVPALLASLQLFTVGTYLPHRRPHTASMPHNARSMPRNHVVAFFACYFFGYHSEHHMSPGTPWWRLWKVKDSHSVSATGP